MANFDEYFARLEATYGIVLSPGQRNWYMKKREVLQEDMLKEYPSTPEEAFEVNTSGLYFAPYISAARNGKRILNIPYDPTLKVHTAWDLGFSDANSIIFFTVSGKEIHIIDYLEGSGISMTDYIKKVKQKDFIYGTHLAPHDIRIHEYSTGVARIDTACKLGISFTIVPDIPLLDGIDAVRNIFTRFYFNSNDAVMTLVNRLETYTQKWDSTLGIWSGRPVHDVSSHAADAIRYLAVGLVNCLEDSQAISQEQADALWKQHGRKL